MNPEYLTQIEEAYIEASRLPPDARQEFLSRTYRNRPDIVEEVLSLLRHQNDADRFDRSIVAAAAAEMLEDVDNLIGSIVGGRYVIRRCIGTGAQAEVYLADHVALKTTFALKRPLPALRYNPDYRSRFLEEARRAVLLKHDNVARVHDVINEGPDIFVVMEHVEGETLRARMVKMKRPFTVREFLPIAIQCASALAAAHEKRIVHLDVKPENIMLTPSGQVKICDFGVARRLSTNNSSDTTTEADFHWTFAGTPAYMAPEVILSHHFDERADLFSLGTVFYEMLGGANPFQTDTLASTTARVVSDTPPPIDVHPRLRRIITRLLAKDPNSRYASAVDLIQDLKTIRSSTDRLQSVLGSVRESLADSPLRSAAIVIVLVLLATSTILINARNGSRSGTSAPAVMNTPKQVSMIIGNIKNRTGESFYDFTVADLLTIAIGQSSHITIYPYERLSDALGKMRRDPSSTIDESTARELCVREKAAAFIVGDVSASVRGIDLNLRLGNATQNQPRQITASFKTKEQLFASIEQVAAEVRRTVGETTPEIQQSKPLASVTTNRPEALALFSQSQEFARRGDTEKAADLIRASLDLDPEFPMALVHLSLIEAGQRDKAMETLTKAYALRDKLPRRESYNIAGTYHPFRYEYEDAIENFRKVTLIYPDDVFAYDYLSQVYDLTGRFDLAVEYLRRLVTLEPNNVARRRMLAGEWANARRVDIAETLLATLPDHPAVDWLRGTIAMAKGTPDDLRIAHDAFLTLSRSNDTYANPGKLYLAQILFYEGKFREAAVNLESDLDAFAGQRINYDLARRLFLFEIYMRLREVPRARQQADALADTVAKPTRLNQLRLAAVLYARLKQTKEAGRLLITLRQMADTQPGNFSRSIVYEVDGEIHRASGDLAAARELLQTAYTLNPDSLNTWTLAQVCTQSGDDPKALDLYQDLISRKTEVLRYTPALYWVQSHLEAARAARRLNKVEAAAVLYDRFLDIWKDSTEARSQLAEARAELQKIRTH